MRVIFPVDLLGSQIYRETSLRSSVSAVLNIVFVFKMSLPQTEAESITKVQRRRSERSNFKKIANVNKKRQNVVPKMSSQKKLKLDGTLNADAILNASLAAPVGHVCPKYGPNRLNYKFYDTPCETLAKALLGQILVRRLDNGALIKGQIVEVESYPGGEDKGSVTYNGRITEKLKALYMKPGTTFVYLTYGMYHCINISSQGPGSAVLLRAVEPLEGLEYMQEQRSKKKKMAPTKELLPQELCNGPSKLCISFNITKEHCNERDLTIWDEMWIEKGKTIKPSQIVASHRIGIDSVGKEWASKPFRFYIYGNTSVSKRDVNKEKEQS